MIVVTTPTGAIGSRVLRGLLDRDADVRVIARDPSRVPGGVDVVHGSHGDPDVVARAFDGASAVFWLPPPDPAAPTLEAACLDFTRPAAAAFAACGVSRVVGVSALGRGTPWAANAGLVTASLAMDDLIASTGVHYRALTMPSFMDNWVWQAPVIRDQGVFFSLGPGDVKRPTCATEDIAARATELLLSGTWTGVAEVPVLGPEDLSLDEIAGIMTEVLGRPVRYRELTPAAFRQSMLDQGRSEAMAQAMLDMMVAKANGLDEAAPRTPESTTPTTFREWCERTLRPAVAA